MMTPIKTILVMTLTLLISACSNSQEPNDANFKAAIQDYLSSSKLACIKAPSFPYKIGINNLEYFSDLRKLVAIGFISLTNAESDGKKVLVLTAKGKKALKTFEKPYTYANALGTRQSTGAFCYGDARVVAISNFTEPANFGGKIISSVSFTYAIENIPDWAKNSPTLQSSNRQIAKHMQSSEKPIESKATLLLTKKGWEHNKRY